MTVVELDSRRVVPMKAMLKGAKDLRRSVLVGIAPDGGLYIAGTHNAEDSAMLCVMGLEALLSGKVEKKVG